MHKLLAPIALIALAIACGDPADTSAPEGAEEEVAQQEEAKPAEEKVAETTKPKPKVMDEPVTLGGEAAAPSDVPAVLLDPSALTEQAPATYTVKMNTTAGEVLIDVTRDWAPIGADRFYNLVKAGYYTDVAFFRVIDNFMAQTGLHGKPEVNKAWRTARIQDDPVKESNTKGRVTFAMAGPNTRTTQIFFNYKDNSNLDGMRFAPFGMVRDMKAIDALYKGYGEGAPRGRGPHQGRIHAEGNTYLKADFPEMSYILNATIVD